MEDRPLAQNCIFGCELHEELEPEFDREAMRPLDIWEMKWPYWSRFTESPVAVETGLS